MEIFRHVPLMLPPAAALAIGTFDGLHLGHQAVLTHLCKRAAELGLQPAVMTFEPHPKEFFRQENAPTRLTSQREKLELLAQTDVARTYVLNFDAGLANMEVPTFIDTILRRTHARLVLVGRDFRFAARRSGSLADLEAAGFAVEVHADVCCNEARISSTAVREALAQGNLQNAAGLLGRTYSISGRVVAGQQLGRMLGYPTANVRLQHNSLPLRGVYAVKLAGVGAQLLPGVANIGSRPTVDAQLRNRLEVHLFDFDADIYGRNVIVFFQHRLRDEMKFRNVGELQQQIARDVAAARAYFA